MKSRKCFYSKFLGACLIATMSALTTYAMFPASVSNEFWCTWGYVKPTPHEGVAECDNIVVRGYNAAGDDLADTTLSGSTWNISEALLRFTSRPLKGLMLIVR
jgi:hypothetical protein